MSNYTIVIVHFPHKILARYPNQHWSSRTLIPLAHSCQSLPDILQSLQDNYILGNHSLSWTSTPIVGRCSPVTRSIEHSNPIGSTVLLPRTPICCFLLQSFRWDHQRQDFCPLGLKYVMVPFKSEVTITLEVTHWMESSCLMERKRTVISI